MQHQAEKFKERQEREGPGEGVGEKKKKKRKSAVAYKNTLRKSEVQFALLGESYSIVFYDRLCFSGFSFHASAAELRSKLQDAFPHPLFHPSSVGRLEDCAVPSPLHRQPPPPPPEQPLGPDLAGSSDCIAVALQRAGCGFGTYSANELVAASGLDAGLQADHIMEDAQLRRDLFRTLWRTAGQQVAAVAKLGLYYNPADVLWGAIAEFRRSLLVYRKPGAFQYATTAPHGGVCSLAAPRARGPLTPSPLARQRTLKVWTAKELKGAAEAGLTRPSKQASSIDPDDAVLGVGPFEWRWQAIQDESQAPGGEGAGVDIVQPDLRSCFALLAGGVSGGGPRALEACAEWLRCCNEDLPAWACELARTGDPELRQHEAEALVRHLIRSCRGTLASGTPAPYRIEESPLFVLRPMADGDNGDGSLSLYPTYIPRLEREVDFVLALRWEADDGRRAAALACAAAGALQALAGSAPRNAGHGTAAEESTTTREETVETSSISSSVAGGGASKVRRLM